MGSLLSSRLNLNKLKTSALMLKNIFLNLSFQDTVLFLVYVRVYANKRWIASKILCTN